MQSEYITICSAKYDNRRKEESSEEKNVFANNMPFEYSSINSNEFTYIFEQNRHMLTDVVGLIYKIKGNAIVSASSRDLFSSPFKDGKNPFESQVYRHSNVLRVFEKDGYSIYGFGTRICSPKSALFGSNVKQVREVLLEKSKIEPIGVFYMSYNMPQKAIELQQKYNIKSEPIRIRERNDYHFYDLNELFEQ